MKSEKLESDTKDLRFWFSENNKNIIDLSQVSAIRRIGISGKGYHYYIIVSGTRLEVCGYDLISQFKQYKGIEKKEQI